MEPSMPTESAATAAVSDIDPAVASADDAPAVLDRWRELGYVVVRNLFPRPRVERLAAIAEDVLAQWRRRDPQTGNAAGEDATCMRHLNHPDYFRTDRPRFIEFMEAVADPRVLGVASALFEGEIALFRTTSLFMNPQRSTTDGNWHRDTQFTTPNEEAEHTQIANGVSRTCGVQMQIALVPSDDVEYVPRSHLRWDTPEEYAIRKADGGRNNCSNAMPGAVRVALEPGDAVVFNPVGHHRGRYHADKARRTLMLTYTRRSRPPHDWFTEQPWFLEAGHLDGLSPGARRFFEAFVAEFTPQWEKKAAG
jgi:ectoine hydroxylase-related dioxygenase (phytanoyl-CoA dioxygenase family)